MSTPRYPLVLVPGLLGFVRVLGYPYWYGIVTALRNHGATVFPVLVSAVHSTEVRGEQLLQRIAELREQTGAAKVHLLGHSQGALTETVDLARTGIAASPLAAGRNVSSARLWGRWRAVWAGSKAATKARACRSMSPPRTVR